MAKLKPGDPRLGRKEEYTLPKGADAVAAEDFKGGRPFLCQKEGGIFPLMGGGERAGGEKSTTLSCDSFRRRRDRCPQGRLLLQGKKGTESPNW